MDDVDPATKLKIWDILQVFKPVHSLCQCYRHFTVAIHLNEILDDSNNEVNIKGATLATNRCEDTFCGIPIHDKTCECQPIQECWIKVPKWLWDTSPIDHSDFLLVGAIWDGDWISVMHEQAAVIPFNKIPWQKESVGEGKMMTTFEMFSGGFGGWCHATKALDKHEIPIRSVFCLGLSSWLCTDLSQITWFGWFDF